MRKIDLNFLMGGFYNPSKDQVLLHALCNLKGVSYTPDFGGISAESLSPAIVRLGTVSGVTVKPTADFGTSSQNIRLIASSLIDGGELGKSQLEDEITRLMDSVYTDSAYIDSMGPFL